MENKKWYNNLLGISFLRRTLQIREVKKNPESIKNIKDPSEKVQLEAVKQNPSLIDNRYIANPTDNVIKTALSLDKDLLDKVKVASINCSEQMQLQIIADFPYNARTIANLTQKAQIETVTHDPSLIDIIKNPSESVQLSALNEQIKMDKLFESPKPKLSAIDDYFLNSKNKFDTILNFIRKPTDKVLLQAIEHYGVFAVLATSKSNLSENVKLAMIQKNPFIINKVTNPSNNLIEGWKQSVLKHLGSDIDLQKLQENWKPAIKKTWEAMDKQNDIVSKAKDKYNEEFLTATYSDDYQIESREIDEAQAKFKQVKDKFDIEKNHIFDEFKTNFTDNNRIENSTTNKQIKVTEEPRLKKETQIDETSSIAEYMKTLRDKNDIFSGDGMALPSPIFNVYAKFDTLCEEWSIATTTGSLNRKALQALKDDINNTEKEYCKKLREAVKEYKETSKQAIYNSSDKRNDAMLDKSKTESTATIIKKKDGNYGVRADGLDIITIDKETANKYFSLTSDFDKNKMLTDIVRKESSQNINKINTPHIRKI